MRLLITIILLSAFWAVNAQPNTLEWNKINLPGNIPINDVQFINDSVGFAAGSGDYLLKSTDAGLHWTKVPKPYRGNTEDLSFVSNSIGYACGTGDTALIKTTDGGDTWTPLAVDTPIKAYNVHFFSQDTGFMSTRNGNVARSYDGFKNSINLTDVSFYPLQIAFNLHFPSKDVGYVLTARLSGDRAVLQRTMDGGKTWQKVRPLSQLEYYYYENQNVQFVNDSTGYVFANNEVLKSTDYGDSLVTIVDTGLTFINGLHFVSEDTGLFFGRKQFQSGKYILSTFDGGTTWNMSAFNCDLLLEDIHCIDGTLNCFAFGGNGAICRTNVPDSMVSARSRTTSSSASVRFAPNPVDQKGQLTISQDLLNQHESFTFRLYTLRGKLIKSRDNITPSVTSLSFEYLAPGMYFYHVASDKGKQVKTGKLVVE